MKTKDIFLITMVFGFVLILLSICLIIWQYFNPEYCFEYKFPHDKELTIECHKDKNVFLNRSTEIKRKIELAQGGVNGIDSLIFSSESSS
jgi:hypothetical protein